MSINNKNFTKINISKDIQNKLGLSINYINQITDDFILILKDLIKVREVNIKNFGTFKTIYKKERIGRNPKNNKIYKIKSRKSIVFRVSKNLNKKIN
ncbi:MAG: HU family DNA-binding protein [Candidatus Pelagibacter sp.]